MNHLDDALLQTLLHHPTQISADQRLHLASDCPTCSEFLRNRRAADPLDGRVDEILLSFSRAQVDAPPPGELEAILGRTGAPPDLLQRALASRRAPRRTPWVALAAGISFAMLGGILSLRAPTSNGEKGAGPIPIRATLAVVDGSGQAESWQPGRIYPQTSAIALRLDLGKAALVTLVRSPESGDAEVVVLNLPTPAGLYDLRQEGKLVGVSLAGSEGHQRLTILATERLMTAAEAISAVSSTAGVKSRIPDDLSVEAFDLQVRGDLQ